MKKKQALLIDAKEEKKCGHSWLHTPLRGAPQRRRYELKGTSEIVGKKKAVNFT